MKKRSIPIIVGIIVAMIIGTGSVYYFTQNQKVQSTHWIVSGPFAISKPQFKLGENVFMTVNNLKPTEAGNILIITPSNKTFVNLPFNGSEKEHFNYYFKPDISKGAGIRNTTELIGTWQVVFTSVKYSSLTFDVLNETLPGYTIGQKSNLEEMVDLSKNKTG